MKDNHYGGGRVDESKRGGITRLGVPITRVIGKNADLKLPAILRRSLEVSMDLN